MKNEGLGFRVYEKGHKKVLLGNLVAEQGFDLAQVHLLQVKGCRGLGFRV